MTRARWLATLALFTTSLAPSIAEGQDAVTPIQAQVILVLPAVAAPGACDDDLEGPIDDTLEIRELDETPTPQTFAPAPFRLGLSGLVGTRDDRGSIAPTWTAGLDLGLRVTPREDRWLFVDVSMRRITVGGAQTLAGDRFAIGASPAVSIGARLAERIELYLEGGVGLQTRFGGQAMNIGVAPFGGGGVRFYVADFFSIAIEGAMHIPATSGFLLGTEVFPQAAAIFQGGLALAFHLG